LKTIGSPGGHAIEEVYRGGDKEGSAKLANQSNNQFVDLGDSSSEKVNGHLVNFMFFVQMNQILNQNRTTSMPDYWTIIYFKTNFNH
jgi:hypothetical protein